MFNTKLRAYKTQLFGSLLICFFAIFALPNQDSALSSFDLLDFSIRVPSIYPTLAEATQQSRPIDNILIDAITTIKFPLEVTQEKITIHCVKGIHLRFEENNSLFQYPVIPNPIQFDKSCEPALIGNTFSRIIVFDVR